MSRDRVKARSWDDVVDGSMQKNGCCRVDATIFVSEEVGMYTFVLRSILGKNIEQSETAQFVQNNRVTCQPGRFVRWFVLK